MSSARQSVNHRRVSWTFEVWICLWIVGRMSLCAPWPTIYRQYTYRCNIRWSDLLLQAKNITYVDRLSGSVILLLELLSVLEQQVSQGLFGVLDDLGSVFFDRKVPRFRSQTISRINDCYVIVLSYTYIGALISTVQWSVLSSYDKVPSFRALKSRVRSDCNRNVA